MRNSILTFLLAFLSIVAFGQNRTITGIVTDAANDPVIGATVRVPGTSAGAITDVDGTFSIDVPEGANQISVSYIGMPEPKLVDITSDYLEVNIGDQTIMVEDIIVTGYTTEAKRNFAGSATKVSAEINEDKSTSDISEALIGEVSGVNVINTSGQPGTPARVRIRGFGSVNGNRSPLYVVDGVPYNGDIASLNPADIESTTVLKDASATALYGSRGANGVIVINTKKGRPGESKINIDVRRGMNTRFMPYYDYMQSPETYIETVWDGYYQEARFAGNQDPASVANAKLYNTTSGDINPVYNIWDTQGAYLIDPATGRMYENVNRKFTPEDRRSFFFNDQPRTEANLEFSGGEGKTTYSASLGYLNDNGYFLESDFSRYTGRARVSHKVKPWLNADMDLNYGRTNSNYSGQSSASSLNGFYVARSSPSIYGVYLRDLQGNIVNHPTLGVPSPDYGTTTARGFQQFANIWATNRFDINQNNSGNLQGKVEMTASFLKHFDLIGRFGYQNYEDDSDALGNKFFGQREGTGFLQKFKNELNAYTFLQMLKFDREFNDLGVTLYAAHENNDYDGKYFYASGQGLVDPYGVEFANVLAPDPTTYSRTRDFNLESYFGIANLHFQNKYFLNGSLRRDGSSRFAKENRWGTFASVGAAWLASDEDFLDAKWLDFLKFRASWGQTGDQDGSYIYGGNGNLSSITPLGTTEYAINLSTPIDPNLTWEKQTQVDFGAEFTVFDRIDGTIDLYRKNTTDLFFDRQNPPSSGISTIRVNDGELLNKGLEFDVTGHIIKSNDFTVDLSVNGSTLSNELVTLPLDPATGEPKVLTDNGLFGYAKGKSIFDYYIYEFAGVNPDNGLSLFTQFYDDQNSNGAYDDGEEITDMVTYQNENPDANIMKTTTEDANAATQFFTGQSVIPDLQGATRLEVGYKGVKLRGQLLYSMGGYGFDAIYRGIMHNQAAGKLNWHNDIQRRWKQPGDITDVPRIDNSSTTYSSAFTTNESTRWLTKSDYLILNNVKLSYAIPDRFLDKLKIQGATVSLSGDNLWAKSQRQGFTPWVFENGGASGAGRRADHTYTPLSTVTGGINFTF